MCGGVHAVLYVVNVLYKVYSASSLHRHASKYLTCVERRQERPRCGGPRHCVVLFCSNVCDRMQHLFLSTSHTSPPFPDLFSFTHPSQPSARPLSISQGHSPRNGFPADRSHPHSPVPGRLSPPDYRRPSAFDPRALLPPIDRNLARRRYGRPVEGEGVHVMPIKELVRKERRKTTHHIARTMNVDKPARNYAPSCSPCVRTGSQGRRDENDRIDQVGVRRCVFG